MEGSMQVERMNIQMELLDPKRTAECMGNNCQQIDCCPSSNDYTYHIAPAGENREIPVLSCGVDPEPPVYQATRYWTSCCAGTTICATGFGQATSTVSQADADSIALLNAQDDAVAQLTCPECAKSVVVSFIASEGTYDLSEYFIAGSFPSNTGQIFRLRDVLVGQDIALGATWITKLAEI